MREFSLRNTLTKLLTYKLINLFTYTGKNSERLPYLSHWIYIGKRHNNYHSSWIYVCWSDMTLVIEDFKLNAINVPICIDKKTFFIHRI